MRPIKLNFKERPFTIKEKDDGQYIFDICRKKYILLTPEEWVRQHIVHLLIKDYEYPLGRIAIEKWIEVGGQRKRFDLVIYDANAQPFLLIECKQPNVPITEDTLFQALTYQRVIQAPYIMLSNGSYSFLANVKNEELHWLDTVPHLN